MAERDAAKFVKDIIERQDLNEKISAAAQTAEAWVEIGNAAGYGFSMQEFVEHVARVTSNTATPDNAVALLLAGRPGQGEISDAELAQVSGGTGTVTTTTIRQKLAKSYMNNPTQDGYHGDPVKR